MDSALPLLEYLPSSFKNENDRDYSQFLWESFELNYQSGKFQFAMLACHMLYMSFVYFSVWQINRSRPDDFKKSMIGFSKDDEKELLTATSPFTYWTISESRIFRFLKLLDDCNNEHIGQFIKLVKDRNDMAHCNGIIYCNDKDSADTKVEEILQQMEGIQNHMRPVIHDCFRSFLEESYDPEAREYEDPADQISEILIHDNYFSLKDIEACLNFDINSLSENENFPAISGLYSLFVDTYREEES